MKKYIVLLLSSVLLITLSGCAAREADERAVPTPIPTFTPAALVEPPAPEAVTEAEVETEEDVTTPEPAAPVVEPEVRDTTPAAEVAETPVATEELVTPEPEVAVEEEADPVSPTPTPAEVRRPQITLQPLAPAATPEAVIEEEAIEEEAIEEEVIEEEDAHLQDEQPVAGDLPEAFAAALAGADPARGAQLITSTGCTACHSLDEGVQLVGPSFYNLGNIAEGRVEDQSAELYLYHSIIHPNEYVVEGFPPGIMPNNYEALFSTQDIAQMVAYLLTLRGN